MSEKLKRCPFCGGLAVIDPSMNNNTCRCFCVKCFTFSDWYRTEQDAINAWNRRVDLQEAQS